MRLELDTSPLRTLPPRDAAGHKGTFGTVRIIGGCPPGVAEEAHSPAMLGAVTLAARSAARSGAGLVRLLVDEALLMPGLQMCPFATGHGIPPGRSLRPEDMPSVAGGDAVVIGPGMRPRDAGLRELLPAVLRDPGIARSLVLDAGALGMLAREPGVLVPAHEARTVLTPHPGEFRALSEGFRLGLAADAGTDPAKRREAAAALARATGALVILKGRGTVVSDGTRAWVCQRGHACLATGGTGDVLAGLIGGLLAQWRASPAPGLDGYELARVAVEAHARAGELWAEQRRASAGMLADELADLLPEVLEGFRGGA